MYDTYNKTNRVASYRIVRTMLCVYTMLQAYISKLMIWKKVIKKSELPLQPAIGEVKNDYAIIEFRTTICEIMKE